MNPEIKIKVNSLGAYLDKEPSAAKEMALHFYEAYLELSKHTDIMIALNENLIQRQSQQERGKPVELPPF